MTPTRETAPADRLAWEDSRIETYVRLGHTWDEALALVARDWCAMTGENPEEA